MVLLAAFKVLLARYSGPADLVVDMRVAKPRARRDGRAGRLFATALGLRTDDGSVGTFNTRGAAGLHPEKPARQRGAAYSVTR